MVNGFGFCCCNNTPEVWLYSITNSAIFIDSLINTQLILRRGIHLFDSSLETGMGLDDVRVGIRKSFTDPLEGFDSPTITEAGNFHKVELTKLSGNDYRLIIGVDRNIPEQNNQIFAPIDFTHDFSNGSLYETDVTIGECTIHIAMRLADQLQDSNLSQSWKRNNQPDNLNFNYLEYSTAPAAGPLPVRASNYVKGETATRVADRQWEVDNIAEFGNLNLYDIDITESVNDAELIVLCHDPWYAIREVSSFQNIGFERRLLLWDATKVISTEVNRAVVTFNGVESNLSLDGAPLQANSSRQSFTNPSQGNTPAFLATLDVPLPIIETILQQARSIFSPAPDQDETINVTYGYSVKSISGNTFQLILHCFGSVAYDVGNYEFDGLIERLMMPGLPVSDVFTITDDQFFPQSFDFPFIADVEKVRPWQ